MVWLEHAPVDKEATTINRFITHIEDIQYITHNIKNTSVQNIALNLSFLNSMMMKSIETQADTVIRHNTMLSQQNFTMQDKSVNNITTKNGGADAVTNNNKSLTENNVLNITNITKIGELAHLTTRQIISLSQDTVREINNLYTADLLSHNISETHFLKGDADLIYQQQQMQENNVNSVINNINTSVSNKSINQIKQEDNSNLKKKEALRETGDTEPVTRQSANPDIMQRPGRHYRNTMVTQNQGKEKAKIIYSENGKQAINQKDISITNSVTQDALNEQKDNASRLNRTESAKLTTKREGDFKTIQQKITNNQPTSKIINVNNNLTPADMVDNNTNIDLVNKSNNQVFNSETYKSIHSAVKQQAINHENTTNDINTFAPTQTVTNISATIIHANNTDLVNTQIVNNENTKLMPQEPITAINKENIFKVDRTHRTENIHNIYNNQKVDGTHRAENIHNIYNSQKVDGTHRVENAHNTEISQKFDNNIVLNSSNIENRTISKADIITLKDEQSSLNQNTVNITAQSNNITGNNTSSTTNFTASKTIHNSSNIANNANLYNINRMNNSVSMVNKDTMTLQNSINYYLPSNNANILTNDSVNMPTNIGANNPTNSNTTMIPSQQNFAGNTMPISAVSMLYKQEAAEKGTVSQMEDSSDDIVTIKKTKKVKTNIENETIETVSKGNADIATVNNRTRQVVNEILADSIPINHIADKVYKQLEKRLRNERQRRGMN